MTHNHRNEHNSNDQFAELAIWWTRAQSGGGGGGTVPIIVPNIAALEGVPSAALSTGQFAAVQSTMSLWTLDKTGTSTSDGSTVVPASAGGRWTRTLTLEPQRWLSQTVWHVNPSTGNDEASGAPGSPVKNVNEIVRRWGGSITPGTKSFVGLSNADFVIVYETTAGQVYPSLAAAVADAWNCRPSLQNATLTLTTDILTKAPAFTGSLLAVTAKSSNTTPGNALKSTFTTTTGAVLQQMFLVNSTRGNSRAWVLRNQGSGVFILGQPFIPGTNGIFPSQNPAVNEVNTWANGDTISGFTMPNVCISDMGADLFSEDAGFNGAIYFNAMNITGQQLSGATNDYTTASGTQPICQEVIFTNVIANTCFGDAQFVQNCPYLWNCWTEGVMGGGANVIGGIFVHTSNNSGSAFGNDVIIVPVSTNLGTTVLRDAQFGQVCIDNATQPTLTIANFCGGHSSGSEVITMYGPGTLNVQGILNYSNGSPTGTNAFRCTLNLYLSTNGYSVATSGGVVTWHKVTGISGPLLDATAGTSGYGGQAHGLNGAVITNSAQN